MKMVIFFIQVVKEKKSFLAVKKSFKYPFKRHDDNAVYV